MHTILKRNKKMIAATQYLGLKTRLVRTGNESVANGTLQAPQFLQHADTTIGDVDDGAAQENKHHHAHDPGRDQGKCDVHGDSLYLMVPLRQLPTQSGRDVADGSRAQPKAESNIVLQAISSTDAKRRRIAPRSAACPEPKWPAFFDFPWDADVWLASQEGHSTSVQRFHLDDGCAVIAADPERARALRIVDMDTPDVGRVRHLIFRVLAALDIKARHALGQHGTGPCLAVAAGLGVQRRPARRRRLASLNL